MDPASDGMPFLQGHEPGEEPGVGELQGEPGVHQNEEADGEHPVLPALRDAHAQDPPLRAARIAIEFASALRRSPAAPATILPPELLDEIETVVQAHPGDRDRDQEEIEVSNVIQERFFSGGQRHVHLALGEIFARPRMAFSARRREILLGDTRLWIARGTDIVEPVAAGAVRSDGGASPDGQPVEAISVGLYTAARDAVLLIDPRHIVAIGAGLGDPRNTDRGFRIARGADEMLPMAVGADRCVGRPVTHRGTVDTAQVFLALPGVAFSAGLRDVLPVDG